MIQENSVSIQKHVLILAGYGGHVGEAYALAQELHGKVTLAFLVPESDELSRARLSRFGKVDTLILPREPKTPLHVFIPRLLKAFVQSFRKVTRKYDIVVSLGSNFCIPPALVAWTKKIPVVSVENVVRFVKPAKTTRILQYFSKLTALQWDEQRRILRGVVVGTLIPKPKVKPHDDGYILVTGGTYGHKVLLDTIAESNLHNIVLQTGKIDPEPYRKRHPEWKVITVTPNFQELIAGASLVITHFGSTVLETIAYRKHTLLVPPYAEWTRTASAKDAEFFAKKLNYVLVTDITLENLLKGMKEAAKKEVPTLPNGAGNLAGKILGLIHAD
jgi:UDP-N-acetylglucosamine--N-acetylmuramyl-(pentapeptide) pyrophosphoryl-undecaprenol N-acetylglucosamine transferase